MKDISVTVSVKIDAKLFRDFAVFDAFRIKKRWKSPALFAGILLAFSALCFSRYQSAEQAVFMGFVLLAMGLGLPTAYFANFMVSVNSEIRKLGLTEPQHVYTVTLSDAPDGVGAVAKNGGEAKYKWDNVYGAYRWKNCTYLYVQRTRAFLLPDRDIGEQEDALWELFRMYAVKCKV